MDIMCLVPEPKACSWSRTRHKQMILVVHCIAPPAVFCSVWSRSVRAMANLEYAVAMDENHDENTLICRYRGVPTTTTMAMSSSSSR